MPRRSLTKAGRQRNPIVAAGTAASTERTEIALPAGIAFLKSEGFREQARRTRNSTEGNEGSEGFYSDDPNRIFVFFVAFCKDLYCIAGGTPATRVTLDRLRRTCLSAACSMSRSGLVHVEAVLSRICWGKGRDDLPAIAQRRQEVRSSSATGVIA